MTPFSQYKGWVAEGGIRNALVVSGPVVQRPEGSINHSVMHIADIMPTLLEVAGTKYPDSRNGKELPVINGKSWVSLLGGKTDTLRTDQDYLGWELFGNQALRQGDWKIRWQYKPFGTGGWELFNLKEDPAERIDRAMQNPDKLDSMLALWEDYVAQNNVILPSRSVYETLVDQLPTRVPINDGYPPLLNQRQFVPPTEMIKESK